MNILQFITILFIVAVSHLMLCDMQEPRVITKFNDAIMQEKYDNLLQNIELECARYYN